MTRLFNPQTEGLTTDEIVTWLVMNSNFPTFDEFKKNPHKWRRAKEEIFEGIDRGSLTTNDKKHIYYWRDQYRCSSLEQAQRIAQEEGYAGSELQEEAIRRPRQGSTSSQDTEVVIRLWPKEEFKRRGGVVFE